MKHTTLAILWLISTSIFASDIELRFVEQRLEDYQLYVSIEAKSINQKEISLAGQNYRFYYNSDVLRLDIDEMHSILPKDKYSDIQIEKTIEHVKAGRIGQLQFDHDLGFINFSIDHEDPRKGEYMLSADGSWSKIITLKFDLIQDGTYNIVWGREGVSDEYATAFVEIGAWNDTDELINLDIDHIDLVGEKSASQISEIGYINIGPNPTSDFINISLDQALLSPVDISIIDFKGSVVASKLIKSGETFEIVDMSALASGTYMVQIYNGETGGSYRKSLIVAK